MKKTSLTLVAAALVAAVGFAAPIMADDDPMVPYNGANLISKLQAQGVNASDPQVWNGRIRVTVAQSDGSNSFQFFDADTFSPVGDNLATGSIGGGNVHRDERAVDLGSLTNPRVE
ncbi:MAG TPA: hypothetical protein PK286_08555 [Devosia sp.]|nr:hypothetical protein [Devosia sp.]